MSDPFYLPRLKPDHATPSLREKHGHWEANGRLLGTLANDIEVDSKNTHQDVLSSISTPFARPFLFAEVLFTSSHNAELRGRLLAEWRGLAALVCFRDLFPDLRFTLFNIPNDPPNGSDKKFLSILNAQIPTELSDWRNMWLIKLKDRLLGATSPLTVFFTAPEHDIPEGIEWRRPLPGTERHVLDDPTTLFQDGHHSTEVACLSAWLNDIDKRLPECNLTDKRMRDIREHLLHNWLKELRQLMPTSRPHISFHSESVLGPTALELYRLFTRPTEDPDSNVSHVRLAPTRKDAPAPLIITESVIGSGQTVILGLRRAHAIVMPEAAEGDVLQTTTGSTIRQPWIRPEKHLLSDSVVYLPLTEDTVNASLGLSSVTQSGLVATVPLNGAYLKYFSTDDIKKQLSIRRLDGDSIEVTLKLPVAGGYPAIEVKRAYAAETVLTPEAKPMLHVWPNFRAERWKLYYLFYSASGSPELEAYKFQPLSNSPVVDVDTSAEALNISRTVWRLAEFPQAIECSSNSRSAGLILNSLPSSRPATAEQWTIGVDFGTSNTNLAYSSKPNHEPTRLNLQDRVVALCQSGSSDVVKDTLLQSFQPVALSGNIAVEPDFPTLFLLLNRASASRSVLDGIAYFNRNVNEWLDEKNLYTSLKWANASQDRKHINVYLEHILILALAEAVYEGVESVDLRWSYPSVFKDEWRDAMRAFWQGAPNKEIFKSAVQIRFGPASDGETESVCAARYFRRVTPMAGDAPTVCVDIGGGSTDIAIWRENKLMLQTALRLGSEHILGAFARQRPEILDRLRTATKSQIPQAAIKDAVERKPEKLLLPLLNAILREKLAADHLQEFLHVQGQVNDPLFRHARSLIFAATSGLLFWVGLLLRHISQEPSVSFDTITVCLGGKASRMIEWVRPFSQQTYKSALSLFVENGYRTNEASTVTLKLSDDPKGEVVQGLVGATNLKADATLHRTFLGEDNFQIKGIDGSPNWDRVMTFDDYVNLKPNPGEFPRFQHFLDYYRKNANLEIDIATGNSNSLRQELMDGIAKIREEGKDAILQPIFIMELQILLKHCIQTLGQPGG